MAIEQQRLSPAERGNLVAYLDGELGENEARVISTKLTQSITARQELEVLEKTWALLDHLPRSKASDHLTERTLSQIQKVEAQGSELATSAVSVLRRIANAAFLLTLCAGLFGLGHALVRHLIPNPTERLARDLSIVEHLDEYQSIPSFDFLRQLESSPQFYQETDTSSNVDR